MGGNQFHRKSMRLNGFDYTSPCGFFVTIVTNNRIPLFGNIFDGKMVLNDFGSIAFEEWYKTRSVRKNVGLFENEFVVMPNHIHGILWITDVKTEIDTAGAWRRDDHDAGAWRRDDRDAGAWRRDDRDAGAWRRDDNVVGAWRRQAPTTTPINSQIRKFGAPIPGSLSTIIGAYKSIVTKRINQIQGTPGNVVWQRNFFDWIIRDEKMLNNVINYIMTNPERWDADTDNLDNASNDQ